MREDANDTEWSAYFFEAGYPGAYRYGADSLLRDSTSMELEGTVETSDPIGFKVWPGQINVHIQTFYGSYSVIAGVGNYWRMVTDWDTTAYTFKWRIDGSDYATTDAITPALYHGSHTFTGIAIRSDQTADTITNSVSVSIGVVTGGPTSIPATSTGTWVATVQGDHAPTTCVWYLDSSQIQSGSCTLNTSMGSVGTHSLDVEAVDNDSAVGWADTFYVDACSDCGETRPPRSVAPSKPIRPMTRPPAGAAPAGKVVGPHK